HDLTDDDAVMTGGGGVQPVNGFGSDVHCRVKSKGNIGTIHIIVDGFGQCDHIQLTRAGQVHCVFLRSISPKADEAVDLVAVRVFDRDVGHVHDFSTHVHLAGFVAA